MQTRAARRVLLALLLASGIGAALLVVFDRQRDQSVAHAGQDVIATIDRAVATAVDLIAAQQAAVAPGQSRDAWQARAADYQSRLAADLKLLKSSARSAAAPAALHATTVATAELADAHGRIGDHLRFGRELMAADVIFGEARDAATQVRTQLRTLRTAETAAVEEARDSLAARSSMAVAATALFWAVGLLLFARVPHAEPGTAGHAGQAAEVETPAAATTAAPPAEPVVTPAAAAPAPTASAPAHPAQAPAVAIDLDTTASICAAISRTGSAAELPGLLRDAARVLDASGLVLWMGAGEELFAVTAYGYDPTVVARLRIGRGADNATAAAWRSGQMRTVPSADGASGAICTPLFGLDGCIGVLAAEVRLGRERDAATRAVAAIFAAQLATIVAAWPAASVPEAPEARELPPLAAGA